MKKVLIFKNQFFKITKNKIKATFSLRSTEKTIPSSFNKFHIDSCD